MIGNVLSDIANALSGPERCYLSDPAKNIVEFDVVESEGWTSAASVTKYPVEWGVDISDHVRVNPESLSLKATITNHTGISTMNPSSLTRLRGLSVEDVIETKSWFLSYWRESGTALTYFGAIHEGVENLVITSLSQSKGSSTGEAVELSISMQKVIVAQSTDSQSDIPQSSRTTKRKGRQHTTRTTISKI
jgi:hypothetical protein